MTHLFQTDFFSNGDSSCQVLDEESGVLFVRKPDGRATGDAFVLFKEEDDADKDDDRLRQGYKTMSESAAVTPTRPPTDTNAAADNASDPPPGNGPNGIRIV